MVLKNESELIKELKNTDSRDKAFNRLLDLYQEKLYWHIRKIVITHDNANDVLQNTFIRIYKGIGTFKKRSTLHTWMYKIAYNESVRFLNKNKIKFNSLSEVNSNYIENLTQDIHFDGDEIKMKLHTVISQLTKKQRLVFQMKYFDDLSFRQISELLGISENTLKSSYYSAVKIIEEKMIS